MNNRRLGSCRQKYEIYSIKRKTVCEFLNSFYYIESLSYMDSYLKQIVFYKSI